MEDAAKVTTDKTVEKEQEKASTLCYLQHLVRAGLDAWWHVAGVKGQLLHLCKVVDWVPVENQLAHGDQWVFFV